MNLFKNNQKLKINKILIIALLIITLSFSSEKVIEIDYSKSDSLKLTFEFVLFDEINNKEENNFNKTFIKDAIIGWSLFEP